MTLELETIPCLADNYAFLVHDRKSGATALFDAPEHWPVQRELERHDWQLTHIFLTHHHSDHTGAVGELVAAYHPEVIGAARDAHRLPPLDVAVEPGQVYDMWGREVQVIDAAGHTSGHVAYYLPRLGAAFTGDSLMALGCGRLFEGTPAQMWATLSRLMALPKDTLICSGHEYTAANGRFAVTVDPDNPALAERNALTARARALGTPTVPSSLELELATNPFLRAREPGVKAGLGMEGASDEEVFAHIRAAKDAF
ncbi:MAG: hydroxyacylglutathione hydrolase [Rhodobacterales bacterium]|nr:MAG: hydroxyacylglutathione hydrolase [Rhodobacterales bacterium]